MQAMNEAVNAATSPGVQMWMNWMLIVFAASLLFVWKRAPARWTLAAFVASTLVALVIFKLTQEPHLLGIGHLLAWTPLAVYLAVKVVRAPDFRMASAYGVWIVLLLATIIVSLVFDVRDLFLVLTGNR